MTTNDQAEYGAVFPRRWIVETILELVGYTVDRDLAALTLLEPSAGSGAFLLPAVERLLESPTLPMWLADFAPVSGWLRPLEVSTLGC